MLSVMRLLLKLIYRQKSDDSTPYEWQVYDSYDLMEQKEAKDMNKRGPEEFNSKCIYVTLNKDFESIEVLSEYFRTNLAGQS